MAYDASETVKAMEVPELTVPRRFRWWQYLIGWHKIVGPTKTYTGRILSHPEWIPLQRRWGELHETAQKNLTPEAAERLDEESHDLIRDTCEAIGIPPDAVFNLPGRAQVEALQDFLACQFRAHAPMGGGTTNPTTKDRRRSRLAIASPNGSARKTKPARAG